MHKRNLLLIALSLLLAIGLPASIFAGGQGEKAAAEAEEATIEWTMWGNTAQQEVYRKMIDAFEAKYPNIKVDHEEVPWGGYHDKLLTRMVGGTAQDTFTVSWAFFVDYAKSGQLYSLAEMIKKDAAEVDMDDFHAGGRAHGNYDGVQYGLPWLVGGNPLFINEELFDDAGLARPDKSWTYYDQFVEAAQKLTKDTDGDGKSDQFGYAGVNGWQFWAGLIFGEGGQFYNDDYTAFVLDDQPARTAFQFVVDLVNKYKVAPNPAAEDSGAPLFFAGKQAMRSSPFPTVATLRKNVTFKWGAYDLPKGSVKRTSPGGTLPLCISKDTKHVEAAWTFVKFMTSTEMQALLANNGMSPPSRKSSKPLIEDPIYKFFTEIAENYQTPMTNRLFQQINQVIRPEIDLLLSGKKTVDQSVTDMNNQLNKVLKEQG